jgi:LytS/YehU family sensor histidine kinase
MQAQLQLLQAQIEPHMLFNTLANLQGMIAIDPGRAQHMLDQLILYLRATPSSSRAERASLSHEFSLMEAYLGLMPVRMGARLSYTLQLPPALHDVPNTPSGVIARLTIPMPSGQIRVHSLLKMNRSWPTRWCRRCTACGRNCKLAQWSTTA